MVDRGGIRVDWFDGRGEREVEEGMELDVRRGEEWRRNGEKEEEEEEEDGEEGRRKRRRGITVRGNKEEDEENPDDRMLELTLSLAVAISVPPHRQQSEKAGSFVVHQHQHNHLHNHNNHHQHQQPQPQQLRTSIGGRNQSPLKQLLQGPSSPLENHNGSSRANLTASLKHLVSQQQPVKVKTVQRMLHGGGLSTDRHPLQYEASLASQLPRPQAAPVRGSSSHSLQDGQEPGVHFQGIGRLASSAQPASQPSPGSSLGLGVHRLQSGGHLNPTHQSMFPKGFPQQSQPRPPSATHRIFSGSISPGRLQTSPSPHELGQQGYPGPPGQGSVSPTVAARVLPTFPFASHIASHAPNLPVTGPQLQAFSQHLASNAVSVASHRQAHPPSQSVVSALGKNLSAFSVVRPSVSGTIPSSIGDIPPRERAGDNHVVVNVCDRKVKLTSELDATSLYALCRRWVRNDIPRRDQSVLWDCPPLPRPSSAVEAGKIKSETMENSKKEEAVRFTETELPQSIESVTAEDLLQHHVEHYKIIRKRFRDNRTQRIARFMPRLALVLPVNAEGNRRDVLLDQPHP